MTFPATPVAQVTHRGAPGLEHDTVKRLVAWKLRHGFTDPARHRHYGVHHTDPRRVPPADHHVDFCLSCDGPVAPNAEGVIAGWIPALRCATARHRGARSHIAVAAWLHDEWLPQSGEVRGFFPLFFHYVNVGPHVAEVDMITEVYLPLA